MLLHCLSQPVPCIGKNRELHRVVLIYRTRYNRAPAWVSVCLLSNVYCLLSGFNSSLRSLRVINKGCHVRSERCFLLFRCFVNDFINGFCKNIKMFNFVARGLCVFWPWIPVGFVVVANG